MINDVMEYREKTVYLIDDDPDVLDGIVCLIQSLKYKVKPYRLASQFLKENIRDFLGCIILDLRMPEMSGIELHDILLANGIKLPVIFMSGHGDIPTAIERIQKGALDFLVKPLNNQKLIDTVNKGLRLDSERFSAEKKQSIILEKLERLTKREREIMDLLCTNSSSKMIANQLSISHNTVDAHRANILLKLEVSSVRELMVLLFSSGLNHK